MADLTAGLLWGMVNGIDGSSDLHKGWDSLMCMGYVALTERVNEKRMSLGLPIMTPKIAKRNWGLHVQWYWEHNNPKTTKRKSQKALDDALAQIVKHADRAKAYFEQDGVKKHLSADPNAVEAYWDSYDFSHLDPYLVSLIPAKHKEREVFWLRNYTPIYLRGRKPQDPLVASVQKKMRKLDVNKQDSSVYESALPVSSSSKLNSAVSAPITKARSTFFKFPSSIDGGRLWDPSMIEDPAPTTTPTTFTPTTADLPSSPQMEPLPTDRKRDRGIEEGDGEVGEGEEGADTEMGGTGDIETEMKPAALRVIKKARTTK